MSDRHDRYIRGLCVDCGQHPHSPGRVRCETCHTNYTNPPPPPGK